MTKTDLKLWQGIHAADFAVPSDRSLEALVDELAEALRDPDPEMRDGVPYVVLRTWIQRSVIDGHQGARLGAVMAERFGDPDIQARTFAPLVLDMLVGRGDFDPAWLAAFSGWYSAEQDLRGHDPVLGWLHAVAHGADLLGSFGTHPAVRPTDMLALATARLLADTDYVFAQQEDDRLAQAIALILTRPELDEDQALAWLDPVENDFGGLPSGPLPAHAANCLRTLRTLYLLADLGVRRSHEAAPVVLPHRDALKRRLVEVMAPVFQHA
ncbi:DUF2785 domain-containing protein [Streptomyces sp. NPDC096176]|uniref:DUF2785 domain-containing protein n=1 Tax=Streptomyces sp. NPDC096176 TaxID=3366079 RepID=UPI003808CCAA